MGEIDAGRLVLRQIDHETARTLLEGRRPTGLVVAEDYPSQFSLEVMDLTAGARAGEFQPFGPFFLVRKTDGTVIGEIGAILDPVAATAQVGSSIVQSCWGQGYATEALRALMAELSTRDDVHSVTVWLVPDR